MIVAVTGGAGFIGTNLVTRLLMESCVTEVRIFDDYSTGTEHNFGDPRVNAIVGDLRDSTAVHHAMKNVNRIVHLGALPSVPRSVSDPRSTTEVNILGTLNVLEAARTQSVEHIVVASSSSVYGANPELPKTEELASRPLSPYAVSKLGTESLANAYWHSYGLPTLAFRFFNVFGPHQRADHVYAAVIPKFLAAIKAGEPLVVFGDGNQSRDFTSVHDVVETITAASLNSVSHPSPVNLAFSTRTSLNVLIEMLTEIHGSPLEVQHLPARKGDVQHSQASSTLLNRLFPDIKAAPFHATLQEVYEWYMQGT